MPWLRVTSAVLNTGSSSVRSDCGTNLSAAGAPAVPWARTTLGRASAEDEALATRACLQTADISGLSSHLRWVRRGDLTDQQWQRLEPLLPPEKPWTGRPNED